MTMSIKELKRLSVLTRVQDDGLALKQASEMLHISYRHAKRLFSGFKYGGPKALIHKARGRPSNRKQLDVREKSLEIVRKHYSGPPESRFGPTLASEHLASDHSVFVHPETLRRWMLQENLWSRVRKRGPHRSRRPRKQRFGEMLQLDGSFHDWFERGNDKYECLMNLVDDATGTSLGLFSQEETIVAAATLLSIWITRYGIPGCLYVDLRNMYGRLPTEKELMEQKHPFSQFGRMCDKLGIEIIFAHSPQAKGRVERLNGVHQDRLIKKMRLKGINNREDANQYLLEEYFQEHNKRFAIPPADKEDFHVQKPKELNLDEIFCFSYQKAVSKDWIVRHDNRLFQIKPRSNYGPAVAKATVQIHLNGRISILYRNENVPFEELDPESPIVKALAWARNNRKILRLYRPSQVR